MSQIIFIPKVLQFGRVPGFEPELLRRQPGVLSPTPMSYTHPSKIIPKNCINFWRTENLVSGLDIDQFDHLRGGGLLGGRGRGYFSARFYL